MKNNSIEPNPRRHRGLTTLMLLIFSWSMPATAKLIDRIVAVVEDDVVLSSALNRQVFTIKQTLSQSNKILPPDYVIENQVLERMVIGKLQLQLAKRSGITVDDETLRQSMLELAQRNGMALDEFRKALDQENIPYADFIDDMRNEIMVRRLRANQVNSRIKVSERELEHYMETEGHYNEKQKTQYHLFHILIATPEAATPSTIQAAKQRAEETVKEIRANADFRQLAISRSDGAQALNGGDLGWRNLSQVPTLFVEYLVKMEKGETQGPIRSPSGFHVIQLNDVQGVSKHIVTQTRARHILIKPNELIDDQDAKKRLEKLKYRIENDEPFDSLARLHSDDKASALKGGDLGWVEPGALVPPFERAMNQLAVNEISEPVQTQFGWHIVQVLERKKRDNTAEYKKNQAREEIRKRKIEEETELWLRRIRDEAYVEIMLR